MQIKGRHLVEYGVLFGQFVIVFVLMVVFRYDRATVLIIAGWGAIFYTLWGILHHALEDRLNSLIALEYAGVSVLAFLLLYSVLQV